MSLVIALLFSGVFLLFMVLGALFLLIVFPTWMLVDCLRSRSLSFPIRLLWMASVIMAWPFGSMAYASFASGKKTLIKIASVLMGVLIILSFLFSAGIYYFRSELLPRAVQHYQQMDFSEVSKEDQKQIKSDLLVLQNEMQANSFFSSKSLLALQLFELFQSISAKPKSAPSEWTDWIRQVASRDKVGEQLLGKTMDSLRRSTIRNVLSNSR